MNILLANMPIEFNKRENLEPPLGICYLAANLKDLKNVRVHLRDYEVSPFSDAGLKKDLLGLSIDLLGVSFRTASYRSAKEFIRKAKGVKPDIFSVAGGHHATAFASQTLLDLGCDAVVVGEGEHTFRELVKALTLERPLESVEGVVYRDAEAGVIVNKPRPPIEDLDLLPLPARELLSLDDYNVVTILTSRGCPFNCVYCDKAVSTRSVKFRSPEKIYSEMRHIVQDLGKKKLYIVDDHFFLNRKRIEPILDAIIEDRLPVDWVCQARVDGITEDVLRKAKAAGCEQIMFGIETGDESELRYMRKGATLEDAAAAVALTKKCGITARANFMLGFPVSTKETMRNTINFAKALMPDIVRFFAVSPLPNTDLWDDIYGRGRIPEGIRWEAIDFYRPSFDIKGVSRDDVSLHVSAGYWHVLKGAFIREITIFLIPNIARLFSLVLKTGRIRGNISKAFPRSINLIMDNLYQIRGKRLSEIVKFLKEVRRLERRL